MPLHLNGLCVQMQFTSGFVYCETSAIVQIAGMRGERLAVSCGDRCIRIEGDAEGEAKAWTVTEVAGSERSRLEGKGFTRLTEITTRHISAL